MVSSCWKVLAIFTDWVEKDLLQFPTLGLDLLLLWPLARSKGCQVLLNPVSTEEGLERNGAIQEAHGVISGYVH